MKKIIGITSTILFLLGGCNNGGNNSNVKTLELSGVYSSKNSSTYKVFYKGDKDPFNYEEEKYGYMLINNKEASVSYLGKFSDRYFEFLPESKDTTSFTFDWYNKDNQKYLTASSSEVHPEGEPIDPEDEGAKLVSISVISPKTKYYQHDEFVKPAVQATYEDSSVKVVTSLASFSGYDLTKAGEQTVKVSYKDKETSYNIVVSQYDPDVPVIPDGYSTIAFQDEFNGEALDNSKWDYDLGNGNWGWGNGEAQYYTKENATLSSGKLHISAKKEKVESFDYTSSRIVTRGKYSFKYGYIEARMSLPLVTGMWPAFWLLPENNIYGNKDGMTWPHNGEIDIMEARGRIPNKTGSALHFSKLNGDHTYESTEYTHKDENISAFHVYACEWKQEVIKFFVDGNEYMSVPNNYWTSALAPSNEYAPFDQKFHIILNLAIGGTFDGYNMPPSSFTSCDMVVDYVRVYQ